MIDTVLLDLSGTLVDLKTEKAASQVPEMIQGLRDLGLKIAVLSNESAPKRLLKQAGLYADIVVCPNNVNAKKPSPQFISFAVKNLGTSPDRVVYLGDNDRTDAFCAANGSVLYFHADWSSHVNQYGIAITKPSCFPKILEIFFLRSGFWSWVLGGTDPSGKKVQSAALIHSRATSELYEAAKSVFTYKRDTLHDVEFFFLCFISGMYSKWMLNRGDIWTTYPGHNANSHNHPILSKWFNYFAREFHANVEDIFIRHAQAKDTSLARANRQNVTIEEQVNTVHIHPAYSRKLQGRNVFLIDDFTTHGSTFEWGRNLLLPTGVKSVTSLAMGKIGNDYSLYSETRAQNITPFQPCSSNKVSLISNTVTGKIDSCASKEVLTAYNKWKDWHPKNPTCIIPK